MVAAIKGAGDEASIRAAIREVVHGDEPEAPSASGAKLVITLGKSNVHAEEEARQMKLMSAGAGAAAGGSGPRRRRDGGGVGGAAKL